MNNNILNVYSDLVYKFLGQTDRFFSIPIYQRYYSWEKKQCEKLFEDILLVIDGIKNSKIDVGHFLGTIVCVEKEDSFELEEYQIIDGQQRIMSLLIFLKVIHDLLDVSDKENSELKNKIYSKYLSTDKSSRKMKLKPVEDDMEMYEKVFTRDIRLNLSESYQSRIVENYKIFKKLIASKKEIYKLTDYYDAFGKLYIIVIKLQHDIDWQNPQVVFESLNSTGMDLTQADLIRNFVLMKKHPKEQEEFYKLYWKSIEDTHHDKNSMNDFLSAFTDMRVCKSCGTEYYDDFKNKYNKDDADDIDTLANDLKISSRCFSWIQQTNRHPNNEVDTILRELRVFNLSTVNPIVLYLLREYEDRTTITTIELVKCLKTILSYVFRHQMCGTNTSTMKNAFIKVLNRFESMKIENGAHYNALVEVLCTQNDYGFIHDQELKEAFLTKDLFKDKQQFLHYILEKLNDPNCIYGSYEKYTIEHIMPQELTQGWRDYLGRNWEDIHNDCLNLIGNLTLVNNNSELSNKTFEEKKDSYKWARIQLTTNICLYKNWDNNSIKKRCEELWRKAKSIWPIPSEYNEIIKNKGENDYSKEYTFTAAKPVTNQKPYSIRLGKNSEDEYVKTWKSVFEKIINYIYDTNHDELMKYVNSGKYTHVTTSEKGNYTKINDEIYISSNISADMVVKTCSTIINDLRLFDEIGLYFRRQNEVSQ